jgi:hypothetical protein
MIRRLGHVRFNARFVTASIRLCCWFLVAFYLVASCRAFIPGACATLNAVYAAQESSSCEVLSSGLPSCCASRTAPVPTGDGDSGTPPAAPQDGHCPFCTLVMSPIPAPCAVILPVPAAPVFGTPLPLEDRAPQAIVTTAFQNRAPPLA